MTERTPSPPVLQRLQYRALLVGIILPVFSAIGAWLNPEQFFRSYLLAYLFWFGFPLGCMALLMLHHLVGGAWGALIRRLLEAGSRTLPLMILLFLPLVLGLQPLYIWSRPEAVAADELLQHKSAYLNVDFFLIRAALYALIWLVLMLCLNHWSRQQERQAGQPEARRALRRLQLLSGPGLGLYVLTITFASIDWVMSLEPHWYSTIYGVMIMVGQVLGTLAFAIIITTRLTDVPPIATVLAPQHLHDLGNLLFAFVMLWAYMSFSQFLLIWSGNLPEEIIWYVNRTQGGWQWLAIAVLLLNFVVPFVVLLSRVGKRRAQTLGIVAIGLLVMHFLDLCWLVLPAFHPAHLFVHWLDIILPLGMGGIWLAVFIWQLQRHTLLPLHDPRLQEVTEHG